MILEQKKYYLRLQLEQGLQKELFDTFDKEGLEKALSLLKASSSMADIDVKRIVEFERLTGGK
jgi:hypothetical protein